MFLRSTEFLLFLLVLNNSIIYHQFHYLLIIRVNLNQFTNYLHINSTSYAPLTISLHMSTELIETTEFLYRSIDIFSKSDDVP